MKLKIPAEELGRFLLAYNRGLFKPRKLGGAFLAFYNIGGYDYLRHETDDDKTLEFLKKEFIGRLD